jgi:hypothetical protein
MPSKILLLNRHYRGGIWIDARYASEGVPFCQSENVASFPRMIAYQEEFEIDVREGKDILYRKERDVVDVCAVPDYQATYFRVAYAEHPSPVTVTISDGEL